MKDIHILFSVSINWIRMAEGEIGSHTIHDGQTTTAGGEDCTSECTYAASKHSLENKNDTIGSENHSDAPEPKISGTIPKTRHQPSLTFHCTLCDVHYTRRLEYVMHVRQCHTSNEKFKCDLCVKVCPNYPALMRHKIMAHTSTRYTWTLPVRQKYNNATLIYMNYRYPIPTINSVSMKFKS